ncbi:ABC transporter substrate-binding protein [Actinokineospora fastidiosa]|uniref:Glycine/betaine ABC transporter substrate-binding protein n=1 Tax=Actinokineospora fastidiosa TaxID=1816 RepID=A0A918LAM9_9PSEU|nr:ABC transporter substrate-binding protein [Actinokineospora fastidiosa]GGS25941.1 glycine/betaine ABC transporter substrate-binding protein [Actinokineospora fastidiosa]
MKRALAGLAAVTAMTLTACGGSADPLSNASTTTGTPAPAGTITVGSANFPESTLLAEIYALALEDKGVTVNRKLNIGSRETYYPGLQDGSIDLIPEYTGVLLNHVSAAAGATESEAVYTALQSALPPELTVLEKSAAENKDAVVVTRATADERGLKTIADLAKSDDVVFGGPPEFQQRPDGIPGLQEKYGLKIKEYKSLDVGGPLTVDALKTGAVTAADLFTTDPAIEANDFVVLEDPEANFAAQNVVPLINKSKATPEVTEVLNAISAKLTTETLIELNSKLNAPDKPDAAKVAREWLTSVGL